MRSKLIILVLSLLIAAGAFSPCYAVLASDKWLFVPNDRGEGLIYWKEGSLKDKIELGKQIDQVKVGPREDLLYLASRKEKTVEIVHPDVTRNIDTTGSPYKGPVYAPVVIAVFSDFQ